jgi:FAD/FMN-containing dehydrogenase
MARLRTKPDALGDLSGFLDAARQIVGAENVSVDEHHRRLMSTDFSEVALSVAEAVVRPASTAEISALMQAASARGVKLAPRGGGMSYTLGYVPRDRGTVLIDMRGMNRILAIDLDDMLVTVEPGVTWAQLHAALQPTGCRIGFMGTMSGIAATVGGGLGNNATGHGRGDITDDLMGLEVVLPDGQVALTGALATNPDHPVLRAYGPDFTGVFTHDAGAFGIKTKAVFRLMRRPRGTAFLCYGFQDTERLVAALCAVERLGVMASNMAFSAYHHRVFAEQKPTPTEARDMARRVLASAPSRVRGLMQLASLARPGGMRYLLKWKHSTFGTIDAFDQASADRMAAEAGRVMRAHGGTPLPTGLGLVMRADPFMPIERLMIGVDGECTFPSNCGVVLSQAQELSRRIEAFFAENASGIEQHGIVWTRLFVTMKGGFGIEPIIYWHDRPNPLRLAQIAPERRERFAALLESQAARDFAIDLRRRLIEAVDALSPYHFQIGKYYDYRRAMRSDAAWRMLTGFKAMVDPGDLMNPGALSLD